MITLSNKRKKERVSSEQDAAAIIEYFVENQLKTAGRIDDYYSGDLLITVEQINTKDLDSSSITMNHEIYFKSKDKQFVYRFYADRVHEFEQGCGLAIAAYIKQ